MLSSVGRLRTLRRDVVDLREQVSDFQRDCERAMQSIGGAWRPSDLYQMQQNLEQTERLMIGFEDECRRIGL